VICHGYEDDAPHEIAVAGSAVRWQALGVAAVAGFLMGATVVRSAPPGPALPHLGAPPGLQLRVDEDNSAPTLRVVLPGRSESDRSMIVLFPEHVTALRHGESDARQLYRWRPGARDDRPAWRHAGTSLEYLRDLPDSIRFTARATLDSDGVRVRYEFRNRSSATYDMIYAVTDPRLTGLLRDVRLERTYVHYAEGLELLAAETPARLTMPEEEWLPARVLASYTWPVPEQRKERRGDGITYYYTRRRVDQPFIATVSSDSTWVVASVTRTTGNVWSNPELTCQHVDPQTALAPGATAVTEMKILVVHGSLDRAFQKALEQRRSRP
jgi:hypothetical protein